MRQTSAHRRLFPLLNRIQRVEIRLAYLRNRHYVALDQLHLLPALFTLERERRNALGMTADELAKKIGVHITTIYRYESNDIEKMPVTILKPLAEALETTPSDLIGWEPSEAELKAEKIYNAAKNSNDPVLKALIDAIDKRIEETSHKND